MAARPGRGEERAVRAGADEDGVGLPADASQEGGEEEGVLGFVAEAAVEGAAGRRGAVGQGAQGDALVADVGADEVVELSGRGGLGGEARGAADSGEKRGGDLGPRGLGPDQQQPRGNRPQRGHHGLGQDLGRVLDLPERATARGVEAVVTGDGHPGPLLGQRVEPHGTAQRGRVAPEGAVDGQRLEHGCFGPAAGGEEEGGAGHGALQGEAEAVAEVVVGQAGVEGFVLDRGVGEMADGAVGSHGEPEEDFDLLAVGEVAEVAHGGAGAASLEDAPGNEALGLVGAGVAEGDDGLVV